jgi:hypothetical protein
MGDNVYTYINKLLLMKMFANFINSCLWEEMSSWMVIICMCAFEDLTFYKVQILLFLF